MKNSTFEKIKGMVFKEKTYFLARREINWSSLGKCAAFALLMGIIGILLIPESKEVVDKFHEQAAVGESPRPLTMDSTHETLNQFASGYAKKAPTNLNHLYAPTHAPSGSSGDKHSSSMILARDGLDSKTQIPPGSRILVRLFEKAIVANQAMPIIGVVTRDYIHENSVAIPQGSKLFGDVSFGSSGSRAEMSWKSVQFPNGRERPLSAIGVGIDGQIGIVGRIHSEALKNALGQTLTRFVGAYAEGSMQRGALGENPGGSENGWKNAISETARDQAENWADDLKKEKRWIEVSNRTEFYAVLTASFAFRDPGTTYGR